LEIEDLQEATLAAAGSAATAGASILLLLILLPFIVVVCICVCCCKCNKVLCFADETPAHAPVKDQDETMQEIRLGAQPGAQPQMLAPGMAIPGGK